VGPARRVTLIALCTAA